jgi:hypothetical protein
MQDPRCCGTGTCLIDSHGRCWCGQQWDGEKMCRPALTPASTDDKALVDEALKADDAQGPPA